MADQCLASPTALRSITVEGAVLNSFYGGAVNARASGTWTASSKCVFCPVSCPGPFTVTKFACDNGTAVSGNIDIGLYTKEGQLIVSTGSTAQAGTSQWQTIDVTDTTIPPGWYYLAMVMNNATGTNLRLASQTIAKRLFGWMEQLSTFPLPATATMVPCTSDGFWITCQAMGVTTL